MSVMFGYIIYTAIVRIGNKKNSEHEVTITPHTIIFP